MSEYKKFKIERLDPISPTFCAAKWTTPNFYLYTGTTSSCQLPEPGKIDIHKLNDINNIDSTEEKIKQRQMMLNGKRPDKCANCWQIEDGKTDSAISERILYSFETKNYDFTKFVAEKSVSPYTITVAFDTFCNFTCSYCDASQSSSWHTDIKKNGIYHNIKQDVRHTYQRLGDNDKLNNVEYQILFNKFYQYFQQSLPTLKNITCLGGEPLISPNFWKFINKIIKLNTKSVELAIITNLSDIDSIRKIIFYKNNFKKIKILASIENIGVRAEFIRNGLVWKNFEDNINFLKENNVEIILLATLPGIALDGLVEFLDWYQNQNKNDMLSLQIHRLRHPIFQAPQVLPQEIKNHYAKELDEWIALNIKSLNQFLVEQLKNVATILKKECFIYNNVEIPVLQRNAQEFYKEFARRHNYNIKEVFSEKMADWILS